MNGRLVVAPSRGRILWRSVGYGAATGATVGALIAFAIGFVASVVALDIAGILLGLIIAAPIAAVIGACIGAACGLAGGLSLLAVRSHAAASRIATRAVAALGAGLPPAAWMIAIAAGSGHRFVPMLGALTVVAAALAAVLGPVAFYGRQVDRRTRSARHPSSVQRES